MIIYSTCRDCGGLLHVTNDNDTVHPTCQPKLKKIDRLAQQWLTAVQNGDATSEYKLQQQIETIDNQPPKLLQAALLYASWGWPVFPLKTTAMARRAHDPYKAAKTPATRNGFKDATTDRERITAWWSRNPDSAIGLATGHAFDVIDIDTYAEGGLQSFLQICNLDNSIHGQVATASGGVHLYIPPTGQGNRTRWKPGTDFRGLGGYVIAPPSRLLGNRRHAYGWVHHPSPVITRQGETYGVA